MGRELLLSFGTKIISSLIYNFTDEITKLPWQPCAYVSVLRWQQSEDMTWH